MVSFQSVSRDTKIIYQKLRIHDCDMIKYPNNSGCDDVISSQGGVWLNHDDCR